MKRVWLTLEQAEHNKLWAKMQDLKGLLDSANCKHAPFFALEFCSASRF